jgi:hypothetical protein
MMSEKKWTPETAAEWARDYRKNNPDYVKRQKSLEKARRTALLRLKHRHKGDYERILSVVKREMGIL